MSEQFTSETSTPVNVRHRFAAIAIAFTSLVGCSETRGGVDITSVAQTDDSALDAPNTTDSSTGTPECEPISGVVVDGDSSASFIDPERRYVTSGVIIDQINNDLPELSPADFANEYFDRAAQSVGETTSVILDESLHLEVWPDDEAITATTITLSDGEVITEKDRAQSKLARDIDKIVSQLSRYKPEVFKNFNVDRIRIADIYKNFGGHYDTEANEILFEFDEGEVDERWVYAFLAHELGHAYHDMFCGGNVSNDPELSRNNSIEYIGYITNEATEEEINKHYESVPVELYSYGPQREFVGPYSTSSTQEDFATIVEWTFANRGLIMPGDLDYNSPLHRKQMVVIDRLEQMIPGSKTFLDRLTTTLRLDINSEIYINQQRPLLEVPLSSIKDKLDDQYGEDPYVLNALQVSPYTINYPYCDLLGNAIPSLRPTYDENGNRGESNLIIPVSSTEYSMSYNTIDSNSGTPVDIVAFVPRRDIIDGVYVGDLIVKASQVDLFSPETFGYNVDMASFMSGGVVYENIAQSDLVPITIRFTND